MQQAEFDNTMWCVGTMPREILLGMLLSTLMTGIIIDVPLLTPETNSAGLVVHSDDWKIGSAAEEEDISRSKG
jgi:hypothetical protein